MTTKEDAIRRVAGLLAASGHVDPAYAESMLGREKVANTYLGEGIAIAHGMLKDREMIARTGIAVVQVPGGVEWYRARADAEFDATRVHGTTSSASRSGIRMAVYRADHA